VCDNFSPHTKPQIADWCTTHGVELVFTPTNASWLNWIESEFTALRYFTLDGSDYPGHAAQEAAIAGYIRWQARQAQTPLRRPLQDPPARLPTQRCLTMGLVDCRG
jgi:hypothetical protein